MNEENEAEAAATRLEMALDRIAALAARPPAAVANPPVSADQGGVDAAVLAGRLDALIAQLRGALAG